MEIPTKAFLTDARIRVLSILSQMKPWIQMPFALAVWMRHVQAAGVKQGIAWRLQILKYCPLTILVLRHLSLVAVPLTLFTAPAALPDAAVGDSGGVRNGVTKFRNIHS